MINANSATNNKRVAQNLKSGGAARPVDLPSPGIKLNSIELPKQYADSSPLLCVFNSVV